MCFSQPFKPVIGLKNFSIPHLFSLFMKCCAVCLIAQLCLTLCSPMDYSLPGSSVLGDSPGKNTGVGCHVLLQGIFPTQGLNQVSCIAGGFLTIWATRGAHEECWILSNACFCVYGIIIWYLFFILLIWRFTVIDYWMLNQTSHSFFTVILR